MLSRIIISRPDRASDWTFILRLTIRLRRREVNKILTRTEVIFT